MSNYLIKASNIIYMHWMIKTKAPRNEIISMKNRIFNGFKVSKNYCPTNNDAKDNKKLDIIEQNKNIAKSLFYWDRYYSYKIPTEYDILQNMDTHLRNVDILFKDLERDYIISGGYFSLWKDVYKMYLNRMNLLAINDGINNIHDTRLDMKIYNQYNHEYEKLHSQCNLSYLGIRSIILRESEKKYSNISFNKEKTSNINFNHILYSIENLFNLCSREKINVIISYYDLSYSEIFNIIDLIYQNYFINNKLFNIGFRHIKLDWKHVEQLAKIPVKGLILDNCSLEDDSYQTINWFENHSELSLRNNNINIKVLTDILKSVKAIKIANPQRKLILRISNNSLENIDFIKGFDEVTGKVLYIKNIGYIGDILLEFAKYLHVLDLGFYYDQNLSYDLLYEITNSINTFTDTFYNKLVEVYKKEGFIISNSSDTFKKSVVKITDQKIINLKYVRLNIERQPYRY